MIIIPSFIHSVILPLSSLFPGKQLEVLKGDRPHLKSLHQFLNPDILTTKRKKKNVDGDDDDGNNILDFRLEDMIPSRVIHDFWTESSEDPESTLWKIWESFLEGINGDTEASDDGKPNNRIDEVEWNSEEQVRGRKNNERMNALFSTLFSCF